jgi:hypothetical protein
MCKAKITPELVKQANDIHQNAMDAQVEQYPNQQPVVVQD